MTLARALAVPVGLGALLGLAGCFTTRPPVIEVPPSTAPLPPPPVPQAVPDAIPKVEPRSRYGNPPFYDVFGKRYYVLSSSVAYVERGVASWYGPGFHKVRTSTGEPYDMYGMTAAHKTLPLPAYVRVTNLQNGRSVVVRVNDRGPFVGNRIIDLSYTAASRLDMLRNGTAMVEVRALDPAQPNNPAPLLAAGSMAAAANVGAPAAGTAPGAAPSLPAATAATASTSPAASSETSSAMPANPSAVAGASSVSAAAPQTGPGSPAEAPPTPAARPVLFVQAGAFADPANAEHLAAKLRGGGYGKIFVRDDVIAGRRMYRVRIGPVVNVPAFDRIVAALEKDGVHDAHLALD